MPAVQLSAGVVTKTHVLQKLMHEILHLQKLMHKILHLQKLMYVFPGRSSLTNTDT